MLAITSLDKVPDFAGSDVHHIISIGGPDYSPPDVRAYRHEFTLHRFVFDDVSDPMYATAPNEKAIARLLKVYSTIDPASNLLFHCTAGISRSPAAAFIWMVHNGISYTDAYHTLHIVRGTVQPNLLMVKIADKLMGRGGKMVEYAARMSGHPEWLTSSSNA